MVIANVFVEKVNKNLLAKSQWSLCSTPRSLVLGSNNIGRYWSRWEGNIERTVNGMDSMDLIDLAEESDKW